MPEFFRGPRRQIGRFVVLFSEARSKVCRSALKVFLIRACVLV